MLNLAPLLSGFITRPTSWPFYSHLTWLRGPTGHPASISASTSLTTVIPIPTITPAETVELTPTPAPTPPPVETPPIPPPPTINPWLPTEWVNATGFVDIYHIPLLTLFTVILAAAAVAYFILKNRVFQSHKLHARLAEQAATWLFVVGFAGLVLIGFGYLRVPLLGWPLLLNLTVLGAIVLGGLGVRYWLTRYPTDLREYNDQLRKERYLPKPKARPPSYVPPRDGKKKAEAQPGAAATATSSAPAPKKAGKGKKKRK